MGVVSRLIVRLQDSEQAIYVELGAGKGYLTDMLAGTFGIGGALMLDSGSFRRKADRWCLLSCPLASHKQGINVRLCCGMSAWGGTLAVSLIV